jgi:uncharacterized protein (DUF427 family)
MSLRVRDSMMRMLGELRHEPTDKWIRATLSGETVVDSRRALLVWEPRRVVPSYAVPIEDVSGELVADEAGPASSDSPVLHSGIPFRAHSSDGETLLVRGAAGGEGEAFRPADAQLNDHVILDFDGFDEWYEEAERILGHPREPYHSVEVRRSSRPVRIERDGRLLAESTRPSLVFETQLPVRIYLPREDLRVEPQHSPKRTRCPYKGEASYWSFETPRGTVPDLAWTYEEPLPDAAPLAGLVAFWDERVDVTVDGERRERPATVFSATLLEEAGV